MIKKYREGDDNNEKNKDQLTNQREEDEDENGVLMVELVKRQEAPKLVDYTSYKNDMLQRERLMQSYATISESMKYFAKIKDYRYKFH